MKQRVIDMTEGSAVRHLLVFAIPMLIGNLFQQIYNLVDSIIVGQFVGADALAAIGATNSITFFFFALCNGIASGGGVITSQFFGAHDDHAVKSCIANTFYVMAVFPLVMSIIAYPLSGPILSFLDTPEGIYGDAVGYVQIMIIGLLFVSLYNYAAAMFRALGDSRTPLYFLIGSCILNIFLDLLFVCGFKMGVRGAGVATIIAQFISAALCLIYAGLRNPYFRMELQDLRIRLDILSDTIKLGVPLSMQYAMIAVSCMALQRVVNAYGAAVVAAFTATSRIEQLIHMPYQTLGSSLSTYSGQNFGADKHARVLQGYRKGLLLMVIFTAGMVPCMQLFGGAITSLFVSDAEVIALGAKALQISSIFYVTLGVLYVIRGVLIGVGDAFFALLNGIVEVIGRFTIPIGLCAYTALGLWGIWWSVGIVWAVSALTAWIRWQKYYRFAQRAGDGSGLKFGEEKGIL